MSTLNLSSLESMISLVKANPKLLGIPALQGLRPLLGQSVNTLGCCGKLDLSKYRTEVVGALNAMSVTQQQQMKKMLNVDEVTFFNKGLNGHIQKRSF